MLGMLYNRWTTDRRMRTVRDRQGCCVLGCSITAADAIEHYVHCPVILEWLRVRMRVTVPRPRMQYWMLATKMPDQGLCRISAAVYVLNKAVHHVRRLTFESPEAQTEYVWHFLNQQLHEATRGADRFRSLCSNVPDQQQPKRRGRPQTTDAPPARRRRLQ